MVFKVSKTNLNWSIARRFFYTAMLLIAAQAAASSVISDRLFKFYAKEHLDDVLGRQIITPMQLIDSELASMSGLQAAECCTKGDYQRFLSRILLSDGKAAIIDGSAGLVAAQNASAWYSNQDLKRFADLAEASPNGFAIADCTHITEGS